MVSVWHAVVVTVTNTRHRTQLSISAHWTQWFIGLTINLTTTATAATANWCTICNESWPSVGMIMSEMLMFIIWPISHHSHPLSSLVIFLSLDILRQWMRMQTPAESFLSLLLRAGNVHLGSRILPGWRPSKVISLPWIWSYMMPENWLRINLSRDWCLCIVLCTCSGACYYWIGWCCCWAFHDSRVDTMFYQSDYYHIQLHIFCDCNTQ